MVNAFHVVVVVCIVYLICFGVCIYMDIREKGVRNSIEAMKTQKECQEYHKDYDCGVWRDNACFAAKMGKTNSVCAEQPFRSCSLMMIYILVGALAATILVYGGHHVYKTVM